MNLLPRKQYLNLIRGKNCSEVLDYAIGCVDGTINANEYRIKACERFLKDLENDQWYFNPHDADFVINICEKTLCHMQGEKQDGTPLGIRRICGRHGRSSACTTFWDSITKEP